MKIVVQATHRGANVTIELEARTTEEAATKVKEFILALNGEPNKPKVVVA